MSRLDWKKGRFDLDKFETRDINYGLRAFQSVQISEHIEYYRYSHARSQMDDLFDEGAGVGRVYRPPVEIPCLHVNHSEGPGQDTDTGFYFNDDLYVTASFDQLFRAGLVFQDIRTNKYLKDRIVYDTRVFKVSSIQILGQMRERDTIVAIEGSQVKADELVSDPTFIEFLKEDTPNGDVL